MNTEVYEVEDKPNISIPKLPTGVIIIILLGIIALLAIATVKVAIEEKNFVNQCNEFWLSQVDKGYYPIGFYQNWTAFPTGLSAAIINKTT